MAKSGAVWGIDLGQSALRALRCRISSDDKTKVLADAYDFVEYPTILGQPDADGPTIIREALKTFLSRNSVKDDAVAISTPGQNGLARFIKLPPVEEKKIPDIVRYEARQQIPFKLEEVVWDFQRMPGGNIEDGFALDAEVGLFAMKREQVFKAIKPFEEAGIGVDFIQLAPLAIFNCVRYDLLEGEVPATIDPEDPPKWKVIMSVGTDTTDLVLTNGFRVWQRSVPLGGNHFTKAITKQLKTTFSKAEHLKKNAQSASPDDAKALFKAMRPVFGDMVTEVQTSLRFFTMNVDKTAEIDRIIALGNAMKLPGLRRFLEQNLEIPVVQIDAYKRLTGATVLSSPAFKDNVLSFGACYGLALQGLKQSVLSTNLVPPEVHRDRMIEEKKPWALAGAAALMLGFTINYFGEWNAWRGSIVTKEYTDVDAAASSYASEVAAKTDEQKKLETDQGAIDGVSANLVQNLQGRLKWAEMLRAINQSLPLNPGVDLASRDKYPESVEPDISKRLDLQITDITVQHLPSEDKWFTGKVKQDYFSVYPKERPANEASTEASTDGGEAPAGEQPPADAGAVPPLGDEAPAEAPAGPGGYVVRLHGYHFHNDTGGSGGTGSTYVQRAFIDSLKAGSITTVDSDGKTITKPIKDFISHPVLTKVSSIEPVSNPAFGREATAQGTFQQPEQIKRFVFTLQFWWEPDAKKAPPKADEAPADAAAAPENTQAASGKEGN
jgi:type IV pilus assembly protein PilM